MEENVDNLIEKYLLNNKLIKIFSSLIILYLTAVYANELRKELIHRKILVHYLRTIPYKLWAKCKSYFLAPILIKTGFKKFKFEASEIIEGKLYLGNVFSAVNLEKLKELKVTDIVYAFKGGIPVLEQKGIEYKLYDLEDNEDEDIYKFFNDFHAYLTNKLKQEKVVFINCMAGKSRSASLVISYFIKEHKLSFDDAYYFVKSKRNKIIPNPEFRNQLIKYSKEILENK